MALMVLRKQYFCSTENSLRACRRKLTAFKHRSSAPDTKVLAKELGRILNRLSKRKADRAL